MKKGQQGRISRRGMLLGGGALLGAAILRPGDHGVPQKDYYTGVAKALREAGLERPTLVVDRARLHHNAGRLIAHLPEGMDYRIVAKSLPSEGLLREVRQQTGSDRLMVFHQPFINLLAKAMPEADLLLGKPMPVGAVVETYRQFPGKAAFNPEKQLRWLVDTPQRLEEYARFARESGRLLQINVELDVGLHRGGFSDGESLTKALRELRDDPHLRFAGFMGYEPHIVKIPPLLGGGNLAFDKAQQRYAKAVVLAKEILGSAWPAEPLLNTGGSGTFQMYDGSNSPANELAMGSGLVMPTTFDLPTLADHQPAAFIAAPVLKTAEGLTIPGLEALTHVLPWLNPNWQRSHFTYGGFWKADPVSPRGLSTNAMFGRSTNQELLTGSKKTALRTGDYVFLRPHQSESVFLQFGDIAVFEGGNITTRWPVFQQGA